MPQLCAYVFFFFFLISSTQLFPLIVSCLATLISHFSSLLSFLLLSFYFLMWVWIQWKILVRYNHATVVCFYFFLSQSHTTFSFSCFPLSTLISHFSSLLSCLFFSFHFSVGLNSAFPLSLASRFYFLFFCFSRTDKIYYS